MNNQDVLAIREFRRFANAHIYPNTVYIIMTLIKNQLNSNFIEFNPLPQPIIKFNDGNTKFVDNKSKYTEEIHLILKNIFIRFFQNPELVKTIRNKIYTEINDNNTKELLNLALGEIQSGNPQYIGLLFNITILKDFNIYLYL